MKKITVIQFTLLILILCYFLLGSNKVTGQSSSPFCNACGSTDNKPLCNGSQIAKCPTNKGNPECRLVNGVCTAVCVSALSADPDADFCDGGTSSTSSSSSSSGVVIPTTSSSSSGSITTLPLNPNFTGIWKGKNIRPNVNPNSLIDCTAIQDCPSKKLHCNSTELFLPKVCTKCARCIIASKTVTLNLCTTNDGQLKGSINHPGILKNGIIVAQTPLTDNVVLLNVKGDDGGVSTLTLQLTGSKKLSGTFSSGLSFDAGKSSTESSCP